MLSKTLAIACAVVTSIAAAAPQQKSPVEGTLTFDAATIKQAAPNAVCCRVMPTSPNRMSIPSMTLSWLIYTAYGDGGFNTSMRVTGGPDWVNKTSFAVEGVTSGRATPQQLRQMLQTLLEDRFALKLRVEMNRIEVSTLVVDRPDGKLGPAVKEWNGTCKTGTPSEADDPAVPRCLSGYRPGGITLDGATMFSVGEVLSLPQSRTLLGGLVQDATGLADRYTMELDYPFALQRPASPGAPPDFASPSLSTAVKEQWGLRIVKGQGTFRLVVVESAQLPTAD